MTQEAMKLALGALEKCRTYHQQDWSSEETTKPEVKQAITALEEALAQAQEPFAYVNVEKRRLEFASPYVKWDTPTTIKLDKIPLYTTPQQRTEQEPFCLHWEDRWGCNHYADPKEPHPVNAKPLYTTPPQRTWVDLTDEQLRTEFGKLYPNDIGILELAENNRDFAVEAIGARHHWVAFQAGARAAEAKLKEKL